MNFLTNVLENFILEIQDLEVIYVYHVFKFKILFFR